MILHECSSFTTPQLLSSSSQIQQQRFRRTGQDDTFTSPKTSRTWKKNHHCHPLTTDAAASINNKGNGDINDGDHNDHDDNGTFRIRTPTTKNIDDEEESHSGRSNSSIDRRGLLLGLTSAVTTTGTMFVLQPSTGQAYNYDLGPFSKKKKEFYVVNTRDEISASSVPNGPVDVPVPTLSCEYALLKVLPVKNPVFRTLEANVQTISILRTQSSSSSSSGGSEIKNATWTKLQKSVVTAKDILVNKHSQLEPVFNPEDSTELSILKGERGEILIEEFRQHLNALENSILLNNITATLWAQKNALTTLGFLGELLVKEFPYRVPSVGKFSYLPRLLGRCQVTLRMKRQNQILGNITIVADGYTAPITAGNFIDLCIRGFYTGLPIKSIPKRFHPGTNPSTTSSSSGGSDQVVADLNILGNFNEGFYDPLTAKLRCIPLEIIRGNQLSYASRGLPDTSLSEMLAVSSSSSGSGGSSKTTTSSPSTTVVTAYKPLLSFDTPGLIALNHPDRDRNGGSTDFFGLTDTTLPDGVSKRILDGEYAPFGFIIVGYEIFEKLKPEDIIDAVFVDDFGKNNLVKIRQSSFKEAAKGTEQAASLEKAS